MKTIILKVATGNNIYDSIARAVRWAQRRGCHVQFEFNGVRIKAAADSNPDLILRDYQRSIRGCLAAIQVVGPYPAPELSAQELLHDEALAAEALRARQPAPTTEAQLDAIDFWRKVSGQRILVAL